MITLEQLKKFEDSLNDLYTYYDIDENLGEYITDITYEFSQMKKSIESLIPKGNPICPYCQTEMIPRMYEGYYDSFNHWLCECDETELFTKNTAYGAYR